MIAVFLPVIALYYVKRVKKLRDFIPIIIMIGGAYYLDWYWSDAFRVSTIMSLVMIILWTSQQFIPLLLYYYYREKDQFRFTLLYPSAVVACSMLFGALTPMLGEMGYGFPNTTPHLLLQLSSLVGNMGTIFLINWMASCVIWVTGHHVGKWRRTKIVIYGGIVMVLLAAYSIFMRYGVSREESFVKVASINIDNEKIMGYDSHFNWINKGGVETPIEETYYKTRAIQSLLLERTIEEAKGGARIIYWVEGASMVMPEDEKMLIEGAQHIADKFDIYLQIAFSTKPNKEAFLGGREYVMINPEGKILYHKMKESPYIILGRDESIQIIDTPYGKLAYSDLKALVPSRQSLIGGDNNVDILLTSSSSSIQDEEMRLYSRLVETRSVENGCGIVFYGEDDKRLAFGNKGQLLQMETLGEEVQQDLVSSVSILLPTKTSRSIYSHLGQFNYILSMVILLYLGIYSLYQERVKKKDYLEEKKDDQNQIEK